MKQLSSLLKSVIFFFASLLIVLSLFTFSPNDIPFLSAPASGECSNVVGIGGAWLAFVLFFIFGKAAYFLPFYFLGAGLDSAGVMRFKGLGKSVVVNALSFIFFVVFLSALFGLFPKTETDVFEAGGMTGFFIAHFFKKYLGSYGSFITVSLLVAVNAIVLFGMFFAEAFTFARSGLALAAGFAARKREGEKIRLTSSLEPKPAKPAKQLKQPKEPPRKMKDLPAPEIKVYSPKVDMTAQDAADRVKSDRERPAPKMVNADAVRKKIESLEKEDGKVFDPKTYKLPHAGMLKVPPFPDQRLVKEDIEVNIQTLESTLSDFGVEAKVVSVQKGPVVTMYELSPQSGTKITKISVLADDIALAMKSSHVRIVAPIPGRGTIGIEIPNIKKLLVYLREVLEEKAFETAESKLSLCIGKDVSGNAVVADLKDMPHLLIAGATGAGKTVCMNSIISSILFKARPDEVKFIMIDPKMVELASFASIGHLIHPIISQAKQAFAALNWAVEEMERRYQVLAGAGCRNIDSYNKDRSVADRLPFIVIVVDELADLMVVARDNIETTIQRLAQLSRAVGIHLILATQRPSVDVITGVIKANFPARISFKVASKVDSRTVLDVMGADKLLGKGDLLFLKPGAMKVIRAQGSFIDDEDIETLTSFIRAQGKPVYEQGIIESEKKKAMSVESDELLDEAIKTILQARQASASILQRRLRVGYTRAARLLDLMEQQGVVGPFCGSKAREILVDPDTYSTPKADEV